MRKITPLFVFLFIVLGCSLSAQNVGISNALFTPRTYLHVHQPLATGGLIQLTNLNSGNASNTVGLVFSVDNNSYLMRNYQNGFLSFQTNASDMTFSDGTERVRFQAGGRVGIGTAAPHTSALLHVNATDRGILIPNVALTATNAAGPIATPQTSLLVYNTATASAGATAVYPGFYYNAGTTAAPNWKRLITGTTGGDGWLTTGNYGTTPANNWIGTNDVQDFVFKTGGTAAANERMRIASAGNVMVNLTAAVDVGDAFSSVVTATFPTAIAAYGNGGIPIWGEQQNLDEFAIWGVNTAADGAGGGGAIFAFSNEAGGSTVCAGLQSGSFFSGAAISAIAGTTVVGGTGVLADCSEATGVGVQGQSTGLDGIGVFGIATGGNGVGLFGVNTTANGLGLLSVNSNAAGTSGQVINSAAMGTNIGDALFTQTSQRGGFSLWGMNGHTSGTAIVGGGNNVATVFYIPEGSGGAFTGTYYGAYGVAADSLNARTSYTQNAAGIYGRSKFNRNLNIVNLYHFGVYGEHLDNYAGRSGGRSGGVLGYVSNEAVGQWGSLGYITSGYVLYGGYFSNAPTNGGGKSSNEPSANVGIGVEGGYMGAHIHGDLYGTITQGERAGLLVEGETYSTGYYAVLNKTASGDYTPSYATVSTRPTIYASGTGTMKNGTAEIVFEKNFTDIASSDMPVIVTVTPMGQSNGLYVPTASVNGFVVKENSGNNVQEKGSLTFSWVAIATVKGQENPVVSDELKTADFHNNLNGYMQNEGSETDQQYFMWFDGNSIQYNEPQINNSGVQLPITPNLERSNVNKSLQINPASRIAVPIDGSDRMNK